MARNGGPTPIPLGVTAYQSRNLPWAAQRCVNWYAETAPETAGAKTPVALMPRPGLVDFATIAGLPRGSLFTGNALYSVFGNSVYLVDSNGAMAHIGDIGGSSAPVSFGATEQQVTISDGVSGWLYQTDTRVFSIVPVASAWVTQAGGYFVHVIPGTGEFVISNLRDGLSFDDLDFATAEMEADNLVAAYADHGELWLFGTNTIEPWGVVSDPDFPFAPVQSAKIQRGCAAPYSIARQDNTLFWIGDDLVVYRAAGYVPNRVSTHAIEKRLTDAADVIGNVIGCAYSQDGHSFYQITLRGSWTFDFDNATGLWHERLTFGENHWDVNHIVQAYGKILGSRDDGDIVELSLGASTDVGATIRFETTGPVVHAHTAAVGMSRLQIDAKTGVGLTTGQGSDPQIMIQWSDDGGRTWSSEHWRSMGRIGEYQRRIIKRRMGQFFQRIMRHAVTDPVRPSLVGSYAELEFLRP